MNQFMKWQVKYVLINLFEIQVCGVMMPGSKELLKYFELIMLPWGKSTTSNCHYIQHQQIQLRKTRMQKDVSKNPNMPLQDLHITLVIFGVTLYLSTVWAILAAQLFFLPKQQ